MRQIIEIKAPRQDRSRSGDDGTALKLGTLMARAMERVEDISRLSRAALSGDMNGSLAHFEIIKRSQALSDGLALLKGMVEGGEVRS